MMILQKKHNFNVKFLLLHIGFWLVVYSQEILMQFEEGYSSENLVFFIKQIILEVSLVYFNYFYLFKKYFNQNRFYYILFTLLSILVYIFLAFILFNEQFTYEIFEESKEQYVFKEYSYFVNISNYFFRIISLLGLPIAFRIFELYQKKQKAVYQLTKNSLENELQYLKNQINPHFLFNALNNIYVQVKNDNRNAQNSIILLSDLLRYQLYECSNQFVLLKREIDYLKNYIELEKIRQEKIQINFSIKNIKNQKIAPFILLPFIENAIKFSAKTDNPKVSIDLLVNENNTIEFTITNNKLNIKKASKGIGLENVKRRLSLLYPNAYTIKIDNNEQMYQVELKLKTI